MEANDQKDSKKEFRVEIVDAKLLRKEEDIKSLPIKVAFSDINQSFSGAFENQLYRLFKYEKGILQIDYAIPAYTLDKELANKIFNVYFKDGEKVKYFNIVTKEANESSEIPIALVYSKVSGAEYEIFLPEIQKGILVKSFSKEIVDNLEKEGAILKYVCNMNW